jgi:hypothetical protein
VAGRRPISSNWTASVKGLSSSFPRGPTAERQRQEQRRNGLQLQGKVIYFFTRDDVVNRPGYVAATVAAALGVGARGRPTA